MARAGGRSALAANIATINAGGGTNMHPGMTEGYTALQGVAAKVKHMIVLTDGQTQGGGYQELAAQMHTDGITCSAVAVGAGAADDLFCLVRFRTRTIASVDTPSSPSKPDLFSPAFR